MHNHENPGVRLPTGNEFDGIKVISPRGGSPLLVTLLDDNFRGYQVHWHGKQLACTAHPPCPLCVAFIPYQWVGFIACYDHGRRRRSVLCLTKFAAEQLAATYKEYGSLRGFLLELKRESATKNNARVLVKVKERADLNKLWPAFPTREALCRIWGMKKEVVFTGEPLQPIAPSPTANMASGQADD